MSATQQTWLLVQAEAPAGWTPDQIAGELADLINNVVEDTDIRVADTYVPSEPVHDTTQGVRFAPTERKP